MKIYIDGLFYKASGIGRYYSNVLKLLAEEKFEIITTVSKKLEQNWIKEFGKYENIKPLFVEYDKFAFRYSGHRSKILKGLEENNTNLFWFPHLNLPSYVPESTVVTIHDLRPFTEWWDRNFVVRLIFKALMKTAIAKAKKIVAVSNFTHDVLIKLFPEAESKTVVLYNFLDDAFLNNASANHYPPIVKERYILFVGNRKKHKNLKNLVIAYSKIKDEIEQKLVIAGAKDKNKKKDEIDLLIGNLRLEDYVIQFISPPDDVIFNLYKHADLFVFPSFYEGFGYPPLEALAFGTPAIASNIAVLRETLGKEIACFDPYNPEDIGERIKLILKDKNRRKRILEQGRNRLFKFTKKALKKNYIHFLMSFNY